MASEEKKFCIDLFQCGIFFKIFEKYFCKEISNDSGLLPSFISVCETHTVETLQESSLILKFSLTPQLSYSPFKAYFPKVMRAKAVIGAIIAIMMMPKIKSSGIPDLSFGMPNSNTPK